jgi:hypothetical protein
VSDTTTVGEVLDSPAGHTLQEQVDRDAYESDLRILAICQRSALYGGAPVPKALWRRIVRYRREHRR